MRSVGTRAKAVVPKVLEKLALQPVPATPTPNNLSYVTAYQTFQSQVKTALTQSISIKTELLHLCNLLRDAVLWDQDISLEDRDAPLPALVRPLDANMKATRAAEEKRFAKEHLLAEETTKKAAVAEKAKVQPQDIFKTDEFAEWDADGVPTKLKDGDDLRKGRRKKLEKE